MDDIALHAHQPFDQPLEETELDQWDSDALVNEWQRERLLGKRDNEFADYNGSKSALDAMTLHVLDPWNYPLEETQSFQWNSEFVHNNDDSDTGTEPVQTVADVVRAYAILKSDTFNWKQLDGEPFTNLSIDTLNNIRDDLYRQNFYKVEARPVAYRGDANDNGEIDMCTSVWVELYDLQKIRLDYECELHVFHFHRIVRLSLHCPAQVLLVFLSYFVRMIPCPEHGYEHFMMDVLKSCGNLFFISCDDSPVVPYFLYQLINNVTGTMFYHKADTHECTFTVGTMEPYVSRVLWKLVPCLLQHWGTNGVTEGKVDDLLMEDLLPKLIDNIDLYCQGKTRYISARMRHYRQFRIIIFLVNTILDHHKDILKDSFLQLPPSYLATISKVFRLLFHELKFSNNRYMTAERYTTPNNNRECRPQTSSEAFDEMLTEIDQQIDDLNGLCERLPLSTLKSVLVAHTSSLSWYIQLLLHPFLTSMTADKLDGHPVNLQLREIITDLVSQSNDHPTNDVRIQQLYEQLIVMCAVSPYFPTAEYISSSLIPGKTIITDVGGHQMICVHALKNQLPHLTFRETRVLMDGRLNNVLVSIFGLDSVESMDKKQEHTLTIELFFYSLHNMFRNEQLIYFYKQSVALKISRAMCSLIDTDALSDSSSKINMVDKIGYIRVLLQYIIGRYTNHWKHCTDSDVDSYAFIAKTSVLDFAHKLTLDTAHQKALVDLKSLLSDLLSGNKGKHHYRICGAALEVLDTKCSYYGWLRNIKESLRDEEPPEDTWLPVRKWSF